ncbi:SDR family NAD(P)-dependent oxidoreductase [Bacillus sp. FJAT-45350]|uniref:SDR family NAD(P)-dependent oxidoreductase n=1 Tax=Bacillus sp. FJAT-45350 TaxID=2011014 RepID=UPI000BB7124B|nr:SDR family oxidoreductase [Bacillus sp. FJAT-45350]
MVALTDKVIVITGAGTGLGRETAIQAVKAGAKVAACCRQEGNMISLQEELSAFEGQLVAIKADVSIEAEVNAFVETTLSTFGRIDVLINNAAIFESYEIADSSLNSWERHFENNVTTAFLMSRATIPAMRKQKEGRIISLTTGLARQGAGGFGAYSASKAALETLTYTIEEEEHANGITSYVFNPGVMKTELQASGDNPKDVAPALLHIASSSNITSRKIITFEELRAEPMA